MPRRITREDASGEEVGVAGEPSALLRPGNASSNEIMDTTKGNKLLAAKVAELQQSYERTAAGFSPEFVTFFNKRCISLEVVRRNGVSQAMTIGPGGEEVMAILFPYKMKDRVVNIKYRGPEKTFWQVKGGEKVLYGLNDITEQAEVVIVEGEMDKLALDQAGISMCVSVPDGAPAKVKEGAPKPPHEDTKYLYLWNSREYLEDVQRFIIATDNDAPGDALAEELARRLGKERCWRVTWLGKDGITPRKDANEVLMLDDVETLRGCIANATPYPVRGLYRFSEFFDEVDAYYNMHRGDEKGVSSGWRTMDGHYRVVPGELTVVTGVPNSGKSEWIDSLLCNLQAEHGWAFALCSLENKVREHARKLLEKYTKKPFFDADYAGAMPRMTPQELEEGKTWLDENFLLIRCEDDELPGIEWVLEKAKAAVLRYGIRGLVIDPYNELDHKRPPSQTETEYVSRMLSAVKRFAQHHDCHVWFVAHPRQMRDWRGQPPELYDISGSAHFINKCDNGIVVHRNRDESVGPLDQVTILVKKVRNKAAGTIGNINLRYNRTNGCYEELPPEM
eukprot:jgi/Mesvir1/27644/Mv07373-RA.2